ncbi:MAG: leucine-rich repeat protein [Ruminococcus sp.]|nr:leucine-rich repeat protein [Ruminococcus sp.]
MKYIIKLSSVVLTLLMLVSVFTDLPFTVQAAVTDTNEIQASNATSIIAAQLPENLKKYYNIYTGIYPEVHGNELRKTSFFNQLSSGGFQLAIYYDDTLNVMTYDNSYNLKSTQDVSVELPIFGGYYYGEKYNFIVCGQSSNSSEESGGETYRIIKYDKNFNRLDSLSLTSDETDTLNPFYAGELSMDEFDGILTIHTSKQKLNIHQSNITICVDEEKMTAEFPYTFVSHSFRQIVKYDGESPVYVDLSDGNPERSVYIQSNYSSSSLLDIPGEIGNNETYTEVSGLEISDTNYFVVGSYVKNHLTNDIYLAVYNKNQKESRITWLTNSNVFNYDGYVNPKIVKINDNRFVVLWSCAKTQQINYIIINGEGEIISNLHTADSVFWSNCDPIYAYNKIIIPNIKDEELSFTEITDFSEGGSYSPGEASIVFDEAWNGNTDINWYNAGDIEFEISTPEQLAGLAKLVNNGNDFEGKKISLINDIVMNNEAFDYINEWTPIGADSGNTFNGTLDGNGHSIYNMCVSESDGGLFRYIGENGIVKAINMRQGFFTGGCIAKENKGMILFCYNNSLEYNMDSYIGSICDKNYNLLYGCKNDGFVLGMRVAGIAGYNIGNAATISSCSNSGIVVACSAAYAICSNGGYVYDCYSDGILSDYCSIQNRAQYFFFTGGYSSSTVDDPIYTSNCYIADTKCYNRTETHSIRYEYMVANGEISNFGKDVDTLNSNLNTILPGWTKDENGNPVNIADLNYSKGIYKMLPEMWGSATINSDEKNKNISYYLYFTEQTPEIEVEDSSIAEIGYALSGETLSINITCKKSGNTNLVFNFKETENNCAYTFRIPLTVSGKDEGKYFEYEILDDGTAEITGYNGNATVLVIPDTIDGHTVTSIGDSAFNYYIDLISVTIPDSVTNIGASAFEACMSLESVIIPDGVKSIRERTFYWCTDLKSVTIPDNVTYIGDSAFYYCINLKDINIPDSVTHINFAAFFCCSSLTSLTIPDSVTSIGTESFEKCTSLANLTIGNSVTKIETGAFAYCTSLTSITIPNSVTSIGESAFCWCTSVTDITIPDSVKSIGRHAFGYYDNKNGWQKVDNFTITGYSGTEAERYANGNGFTFIDLDNTITESPTTTGPTKDTTVAEPTGDATTTAPTEGTDATEPTEITTATGPSETDPTTDTVKTTVTVKNAPKTLYVKGTAQINTAISNGKGTTTYKSSNTKVAKVNASGKITALKKGTATITVTNNGTSKSFKISVKNPKLTKTKKTLKKGKKFTLKITGGVGTPKFTSSNKKVAKVNKNGKITAKKKGKATITVKTNGMKLKCKITVK